MTKLLATVPFTIAGALAASGAALAQPEGNLAVWSGYQSGHLIEALSLTETDPAIGPVSVRSELVWPLDVMLVEGSLELRAWTNAGREVGLVLKGAASLSTPGGSMRDSDWIAVPRLEIPESKFSYTESGVELSYYRFDAALRVGLARDDEGDPPLSASVLLGYRHAQHTYDAFGLDGAQSPLPSGSPIFVHLHPSMQVLHFEARRMAPYLGLAVRCRVHPRLRFDAEADLLAMVARDVDDHVLRHKLAEGAAYGPGVSVGLRPRWEVGKRGSLSLAIGANVELEYYVAPGTLRQHFYADDPGTLGDDTAMAIPDSDYLARGKRLSIAASIDVGF